MGQSPAIHSDVHLLVGEVPQHKPLCTHSSTDSCNSTTRGLVEDRSVNLGRLVLYRLEVRVIPPGRSAPGIGQVGASRKHKLQLCSTG